MKLKNELGFGAIGGLIIIAVILLIGAAGWLVISKNKDSKAPSPVVSKTTSAAPATQSSNNTDGATKHLTIKEWGVKLALTTDTADAYYDTKTASPLDSMSLRVHSLDTESDCTTAPQSVASIFRVPKGAEDDMMPGKKYSETRDGKTIGDYFYFISGSQYNCTQDTAKLVVLQGVRNSFDTASPTIQAE